MVARGIESFLRRNKLVYIAGVVLALVLTVELVYASHDDSETNVSVGKGVYSVRVASSQSSREKGLSGTSKLESDRGMLFVFAQSAPWGIWMKDMKYPIDIVWLDQGKHVVYVVEQAEPASYPSETFHPDSEARYVLELPSGTAKEDGIRVGGQAEFNLPLHESERL